MDRRRDFLKKLAGASGALVVAPYFVGCTGSSSESSTTHEETSGGDEVGLAVQPPAQDVATVDPLALPNVKPVDWDAITFNRERGMAGAIPETYHASINGPNGDAGHIGKHIPYLADVESEDPTMIAIMFGDDAKSYARHPNQARTEENPDGHWFDWIRIRKATEESADEVECRFSSWPEIGDGDTGRYATKGGGDITEDGGKNTVYLVPLPAGIQPGDTIRVVGHCSSHGEYVDFLTLPA